MKKTMKKFLSMAALALVGAVMTGCSSDDDSIISNQQQPENKSKVVTLTTTVSLDGSATTRALTTAGVKTFAAGEKMAVIYHNGSSLVKAESNALTDGNITDAGKTATFTFDLETPDKSVNVTYIYPAAMAGETGVDLTKLNTQEGTFDALQSKYDLCTTSGEWKGEDLPSLTLENQLAILAITLKDISGSSALNKTITYLTINDGTNNYAVTRSAVDAPIYVAIQPTDNAKIWISATAGSKNYIKSLTKTYAKGYGYNVGWKMATVGDVIKSDGTFAPADADGAVAKIFYVGNDAETSASNTTFKHGLALALREAGHAAFCNQTSAFCLSHQYGSGDLSNDLSGIDNTDELVNHTTHSHDAARIARNFKYADDVAAGAHPSGTSEWFLPSAGQWNKMMDAAGGYNILVSKAGLSVSSDDGYYWASTESSKAYAWRYFFRDGNWSDTGKTAGSSRLIRACLAF